MVGVTDAAQSRNLHTEVQLRVKVCKLLDILIGQKVLVERVERHSVEFVSDPITIKKTADFWRNRDLVLSTGERLFSIPQQR